NIATINSVNISSPFLEEMSKVLGVEVLRSYGEYDGEGNSINSTDAQAWITPKRWKFLINGLGKWTKTHDSLYKKMISKEPQVYEIEELKIAAQPLKGVYFGLDSNNKPVYLKYSQAVLSPNLVNNLQLENMLNIMESQNV